MWARRRHSTAAGLEGWNDAPPAARSAGAAAALPSPSFAAEDAPEAEPKAASSRLSAAATDVRVDYRQTKQFKPAADQLVRHRVIGPAVSGAVNAAYNMLRTQIFKRVRDSGWTTIAITSPTAAAGTTLTAINLAVSMARDVSHTVLLVELNLVHPSLRDILGFEHRQGVVDHLLHDVPIADLLINPGIDRLVVIPAGSPVANSSDLLASPRMARLVQELKCRYERRIVLFDLPPVLAVDDAMAFSPLVDCALLVVEEGDTRISEVGRALDYMSSTNLLGVVLNRSLEVEKNARLVARRASQPRPIALTDPAGRSEAPALRRQDRSRDDRRAAAEPWVAAGSRESTS
jgi:capsular exopolysaccharide synthesis family protein